MTMKSPSSPCFCGKPIAKNSGYCLDHRRDYARAYRHVYYAKNKEAVIKDVNKRNKEVYKYKFQKAYQEKHAFALSMYQILKNLEKNS